MSETIIGYVAVDDVGLPYQPTLGRSYHSRTKPITVYKHKKYAEQFTGKAVPVYVRDINE